MRHAIAKLDAKVQATALQGRWRELLHLGSSRHDVLIRPFLLAVDDHGYELLTGTHLQKTITMTGGLLAAGAAVIAQATTTDTTVGAGSFLLGEPD